MKYWLAGQSDILFFFFSVEINTIEIIRLGKTLLSLCWLTMYI